MKALKLVLASLLIIAGVNAAVWERPAGAYTPSNHSVNINKYQTDSANRTVISSAKVDGDINKAFQGLNDIEARTPPSVTGQSGLFLTNNGVLAQWASLPSTAINFLAPPIFSVSGTPVGANGTISLSLVAQASSTFLAGPVSGTASPTFRAISASDVSFIVSNTGGSLTVMLPVSASYVTATNITATNGIALRRFAQSGDAAISGGATINVSHGCGAPPRMAWAELVNVNAELGYSTGMTAQLGLYAGQGSNVQYGIGSDSTSSALKIGSAGSLSIINLSTGSNAAITNGNWNIRLKTAC